VLALRQAEQALGALAQVVGQRSDRRLQPVGRHGVGLAPGDVAATQRAVARQHGVEPAVGGGEVVLGHGGGAGAVALLDLVEVGDRLAGQPAGAGAQSERLGPQPAPAPRVERVGAGAGAVAGVEVGHDPSGLGRQLGRGPRRLGADPGRQLGRAVVGVDEAVDVTPQPQPEREVPLDEVGHLAITRDQSSVARRKSTVSAKQDRDASGSCTSGRVSLKKAWSAPGTT